MIRRELGNSGILVPPMTVGCWAFGGGAYWGAQPQKDVDQVVAAAIDLGLNCFDTAEMYNDGASETSLGAALKGRRHETVIITKIKPSNCIDVRKWLEQSLLRLQTDYVDNYMLHWPINAASMKQYTSDPAILADPPTIGDALHQMDALKKEGKIRSIGLSNFGVKQMEEALGFGVRIDTNEICYNILSRAIESKIVPFCHEHGLSIIGTMGLQQGLLADLFKTASDVPAHQARSRHFADARSGGMSRHGGAGFEKEVFALLDTLRSIANKLGLQMAQLSIAWILSKPFILSTLIGSRSLAEMEANAKACDFTLPEDVTAEIDAASLPLFKLIGDNPDLYESDQNSRIY